MESLCRRPQTARQAPALRQNPVRQAFCRRGRIVTPARPVTPVTCLCTQHASSPGNKATFFARQCATFAICAASQITQPLWCSALGAAASDCGGQTEPVVHFLLAALVVGASIRVKELLTTGVSVGDVKDEKTLVAKARARHRAFLREERALLTAEQGVLKPAFPTSLLQLSNLGPAFLSFPQPKASPRTSGLALTAAPSPAPPSADAAVQSSGGESASPLRQGKRLPVPVTAITEPVIQSVLKARGASLLMPVQALSSAAVRAFRKSVGLPNEEPPALSPAPLKEATAWDAPMPVTPDVRIAAPFAGMPGVTGGKFAVGASTVVEDVDTDDIDGYLDSPPSVRFPALEELFLRSPDEPMERPHLPNPFEPAQVTASSANPGAAASPGAARRRRDPADFVAPNLTASRARAMLRLDTDREAARSARPPPPPPMPVASPAPVSRITRVTEPSFRPHVLRKTLDPADRMPPVIHRAVPMVPTVATVPAANMPRMGSTRPTPREMAKARTMGSLRNENGARIRGASSRPVSAGLTLDLAAVEEARTRSAAYEAKVAELWRAADRRRQEEVKKMRQREWQLMDALPRKNAQATPWTAEASKSVRQAIDNIRKPGLWAFISSLWTGFWSNLTHRVDSHLRRPRDMFAGPF